jgi:hypothetical protein
MSPSLSFSLARIAGESEGEGSFTKIALTSILSQRERR